MLEYHLLAQMVLVQNIAIAVESVLDSSTKARTLNHLVDTVLTDVAAVAIDLGLLIHSHKFFVL